MSDYRHTNHASDSALYRRLIRQSDLSPTDRLILQDLVNLWFAHRNEDGFIHPGRGRLAKSANVSIATVKRSLCRFRDAGLITAIDHARGGGHFATRYVVDFGAIENFASQPPKTRKLNVRKSVTKPVGHAPVGQTRGSQAGQNDPRSYASVRLSGKHEDTRPNNVFPFKAKTA